MYSKQFADTVAELTCQTWRMKHDSLGLLCLIQTTESQSP